ncbi:MAG TPA: metalloregulator ArsR/SmtB family transcription factor [Candidatus Limnocylindria bacterium]
MIKNRFDMTMPIESGADRDLRRLRTFYKALGDETRLRIIGLLAEGGPMPVHALSAGVGLSQPLISWHLRILRLARLIDTQRQGRAVICRLRLAAFEELHEAEARLIGGTVGVRAGHPAAGEVPDVG